MNEGPGASARAQRAVSRSSRIASDVAPPARHASCVVYRSAVCAAASRHASRRSRAASPIRKMVLAARRSRRRRETDSRRGVE
ncbi:hypothetical protein EZV77_18505 [Burkholderia thailandensis]|nr:hypothetical protein A8H32_08540 [Burkholderia thailandensis]MDD1481307.1 hypothetical protein [Burkholderia thailandensis]MDD1487972.1 hypothetical protein [Burkholderia thailandensis]MDD1494266.1 hypothetical protein [Burkholderia thailandensis]PJO71883.1 hypothetical protein CWD92_13520 [Burkholderia thailandensis]